MDLKYGKYNTKITVYGVDVSSDVSAQPVNEETMIGCKNRLDNLKKYVDHHKYKYDYIVSIESGISFNKSVDNANYLDVYDFCCLNITSNNESDVVYSHISDDKTYFPAKYLISSLEENKNITAASIIEKEYGVKTGAWHQLFSNFTRLDMMTNTIKKCLSVSDIEVVD